MCTAVRLLADAHAVNGGVKDAKLIDDLVQQTVTSQLGVIVRQEIQRSVLPCMSSSHLLISGLLTIFLAYGFFVPVLTSFSYCYFLPFRCTDFRP